VQFPYLPARKAVTGQRKSSIPPVILKKTFYPDNIVPQNKNI
jgi:hypothetical protein